MTTQQAENLKLLLQSPDQSKRLTTALNAGTYPEPDFIDILVEQCAVESDFFVRDTLSWALMRNNIPLVVERLKLELKSNNPQALSQAIHTFSKIGDKANFSLITDAMLFHTNDLIASTAWRASSVLAPEEEKSSLVEKLITQLGRGDSDLQFGLTRFLCALGASIVEPLTIAAKTSDEVVRMHAEFTLIRFKEMQLENTKAANP